MLQGPAGAAGLPGEVGHAGPPVSTTMFAKNVGSFNCQKVLTEKMNHYCAI